MVASIKNANILTQTVPVPRISGTRSALSAQALHNPTVADRIRTVAPNFTPPKVELKPDELRNTELKDLAQSVLRGETDNTTIGDLLWSSRRYPEVESALRDIIAKNMAGQKVSTLGLNDLGRIGNPFSVYWSKPNGKQATPVQFQYLRLTTAYIDYCGTDYKPFIMGAGPLSKQLLDIAGFRQIKGKSSGDLPSISYPSEYGEKKGVIVVDWNNANRIKDLLSWTTGLPLGFMPLYRDASLIDTSYSGHPQMEAILKAVGRGFLEGIPSVFWMGISGFSYSEHPQVTVFDKTLGKSGSLSDRGTAEKAAILFTIGKSDNE